MITILCSADDCGVTFKADTVYELLEYAYNEVVGLNLPQGWFEVEGRIYCGLHMAVKRTGYDIVPRVQEEFPDA